MPESTHIPLRQCSVGGLHRVLIQSIDKEIPVILAAGLTLI